MAANIAQRARALATERMPEESARLAGEAEQLAAEARAVKADTTLGDADRAAKEKDLLRRAASLERQTAAAEREAFTRMSRGARTELQGCRDIAKANENVPSMKQFEGQINGCARSPARSSPTWRSRRKSSRPR